MTWPRKADPSTMARAAWLRENYSTFEGDIVAAVNAIDGPPADRNAITKWTRWRRLLRNPDVVRRMLIANAGKTTRASAWPRRSGSGGRARNRRESCCEQ